MSTMSTILSWMQYLRHPIFVPFPIVAHGMVYIVATPPTPEVRFPAALAVSLHSFLAYCFFMDRDLASSLTLGRVFFMALYSTLCLNDMVYMTPLKPPPGARTMWAKVSWFVSRALDYIGNPRGKPTAEPSPDPAVRAAARRRWMARQALLFMVCWLGAKAWMWLFGVYWVRLNEDDYTPAKTMILRRIGDASLREVLIRLWLVFQFVTYEPISLTMWYAGCSLVLVAVFGVSHERWLPMFGDLRESYSLHRWWGITWHQLHRRGFVTHGKALARPIIRGLAISNPAIQRGLIKLAILTVTLLAHVAEAWQHGEEGCAAMPHAIFWAAVACAMLLEDACAGLCARLLRPGAVVGPDGRTRGWVKGVGYVWVIFFLWWSVPKYYMENWSCGITRL